MAAVISSKAIVINGGVFTQNNQNITPSSGEGFRLLSKKVATQARHDSGQLSDPAKCHPDTRIAILADLEQWAERPPYDYPIRWVTGSAGVGKTAIMRTTAETLERRKLLLASFFFWRSGDRCSTAEYFISTLAYQITISIPQTRSYIDQAVEGDPHIFTRTLEVQSQALIVNPIVTLHREQGLPSNYPRLIIVDGLDECLEPNQHYPDAGKQREVLRVLLLVLQQLPMPFALLIASRPENHIQKIFDTSLKEATSRVMLNDSHNANNDIRRFYTAKFREIREHHPLASYLPHDWPPSETIDTLVSRASGQFIYASTVIKFVAAGRKNPHTQLNAILNVEVRGDIRPFEALDLLYSTIFSFIDEEDVSTTLRVLGVLLVGRSSRVRRFAPSSFPPSFWDRFLILQPGEVERLMLGLESILNIRGLSEDYFRFYHASLQDFLFDSSRSGPFFIDKGLIYVHLTKLATQHLSVVDEDITAYIIHGIDTWLSFANPSTELVAIIEQQEMTVHPQNLKVIYPALLKAIEKSNLPLKKRLFSDASKTFRAHLIKILDLYLKEDLLLFLILAFLSRKYSAEPTFDAFIDKICPLLPEVVSVDKDQGFYVYGDLLFRELDSKWEAVRDHCITFTKEVEHILHALPQSGDLYAKAASIFVRALSQQRSRYLVENPISTKESFQILGIFLDRASTQSGLSECIQTNSISEGYLEYIKPLLDAYLLRDQKSQWSISRAFSSFLSVWK